MVSQVIHHDSSEAEVIKEKMMIPPDNTDSATGSDASPSVTGQSDQNKIPDLDDDNIVDAANEALAMLGMGLFKDEYEEEDDW